MHVWKEAYVIKKLSENSDLAYKRMEFGKLLDDRDYIVYRYLINNKKN